MADNLKKTFTIEIAGVKESVTNLESLEDILVKMEKQVETINKNGGFSVVSKEANKNTKEAIDLAKAEQIAQGEVVSSYKEKQKALSTLGKEIKSMTVADGEAAKKQQEMIQQYNGLNDQLKRFDASMGNHQRNVGNYSGALKAAKEELKEIKAHMMGLDQFSAEFEEWAKRGGDVADKIGDINAAIKREASDTKSLDAVIDYAKSATAAFQLYKGAMSAFGLETKEAEEAMQQLVGAMNIVQSLQTLSETFKSTSATGQLLHKMLQLVGLEAKNTAASTTAMAAAENTATVAQEKLTVAQKAGAIASKTLSVALRTIPLLLIISLVTELVLHWEEIVGWFTKTFPVLKNLSGWFNKVRGTISGLIDAVWAVIKSFGSLGDIMKAIFSGHWEEAAKIAKQNIANITNAYKTGYADKMGEIEEEVTRKKAAESNKRTKQELEELKIQERNNKTYSKKYIDLQKKDFAERKKLAKGNQEELNKIKLEEMQFFADVEDKKTAAAKKGASERAKAAKKEAAEVAKQEEEAAKKNTEATKKLDDAFYKSFQADIKEDLRNAELEVEKFADGPIDKLIDALYEVEDIKGKLLEGEETKTFNDLWNGLDDNLKKVFGSVEKMREQMGYLTLDQLDVVKEISKSFSGTTKSIKDQTEAFQKGVEETLTNIKTIQKNAETNRNVLDRESVVKLAEGFRKAAQAELKNAENIYKNFLENIKKVDVEPIRNKFTGIVDEKATAKKLEGVKALWVDASQKINAEVVDTETHWNQLITRLEQLYTKDSQIYKDAVQQKIEALTKLKNMQQEVAKRADNPVNPTNTDYNGDGTPEVKKPEKFLWAGKDRKKQNGDPYSVVDNLANLFNELDEMVLGPAMDTFNMFMDFAIEETQARLDEVMDMHDDALEKVEESTNRIKDLNDSLKDSSNTNIEVTKQQLADEQLLYAQRLAEEQKLAQEERALQNKANEQEYQQRKMELGYQLILGIANTAQGASKALAEWGWPLGPIFAGVMAALGAVQTALIAKQLASLPKPKKLADGGLITGPSHKQGGIQVGRTGIEVEGGEAVISKNATKKFLPLLDAINAAGNGGKHTLLADKKIRKFANGGQLNFEKVDSNLRQNNDTNRILGAMDNINFQPVVSVVDFEKVQNRLVKVRSLAGR